MRVAGQILQYVFWSAEGWLGIDDPILPEQLAQKGPKAAWSAQMFDGGTPAQPDITVSTRILAQPPSDYLRLADIAATDLVYDQGTHRLYASISAKSPVRPNTIAVINPSTGNVSD